MFFVFWGFYKKNDANLNDYKFLGALAFELLYTYYIHE